MSDYLFVAEADKIQDLLFRSSKLREVAGGSQMLDKFCEDVVCELIKKLGGEKVISAGGSFRIRFDSKERAKEFGDYLSELYRRKLGGTITIAEPVEVTTEPEAIENAQKCLRKAKHGGKYPVSVEQMPYIAICVSCGVGIARYHEKRFEGEKPNYLCEICNSKAKAWKNKEIQKNFLSGFIDHISKDKSEEPEFSRDVGEIAESEGRNYIAYIIADVNNMGTLFSACGSFEKMENLSDALGEVIRASLAEPTKTLMEVQNSKSVPVLPLIIGGDDIFAVVPAQCALDFARRFSYEFEKRMEQSIERIGIQRNHPPTISVAVIICKGKFPYLIAYERGEEMLKIAKKRAKEEKQSTISFELIKGNELIKSTGEEKTFIAGFPAYTIEELEKLVKYRFKLKELPGTRRAQLEDLFLRTEKMHRNDKMSEWMAKRTRIIKRLKGESLRDAVSEAMIELGDSTDEHNWIWVENETAFHHKLPDLLAAWDYTYNLGEDMLGYEGEE